MRAAVLCGVVPALLLLFFSCGDNSVLLPELEEEEEQSTIQTIDNGSLLSSGDSIPVELVTSEEETPDRLKIALRRMDGSVIGTTTLEGEQLSGGELPPVEVPELEPGTYLIVFTLYRDGKQQSEEERTFFVAQHSYRITNISTYPASLFPSSTGLAQAQLAAPESSDPYLRWSLGEEVIAEGLRSEGFDEIRVTAPQEEGVYSLTLELFPSGPGEEVSLGFASQIAQTTELVVRRTAELGGHDLAPENSYYALFHFMGNIRDVGMRRELLPGSVDGEAVPIGEPRLEIMQDVFGYYLNGSSGFAVDAVLVPFRGERISPFSINMRLVPSGLESEELLFRTASRNGEFELTLRVSPAGQLTLEISYRDSAAQFRSRAGFLQPEQATSLSVALIPGDERLSVVWYRNGVPESVTSAAFAEAVPARKISDENARWTEIAGRSSIGGEDGFTGLVDEFGIYFRDRTEQPNTDNELFRKASEKRHGSSLLYAEGFEGLFLPDELVIEGDVAVATSTLLLKPGSTVAFPAFMFEREAMVLEIKQEGAASDGSFRVYQVDRRGGNQKGRVADAPLLFSIRNADRILQTAGGDRARLGSENKDMMRIRIAHAEEKTLSVGAGEEQVDVPLAAADFGGIRLRIESGEVTMRVHSVLAYRTGDDFSDALDLSEVSPGDRSSEPAISERISAGAPASDGTPAQN